MNRVQVWCLERYVGHEKSRRAQLASEHTIHVFQRSGQERRIDLRRGYVFATVNTWTKDKE